MLDAEDYETLLERDMLRWRLCTGRNDNGRAYRLNDGRADLLSQRHESPFVAAMLAHSLSFVKSSCHTKPTNRQTQVSQVQ